MEPREVDLDALVDTRDRARALLAPLMDMSPNERLRWLSGVRPREEDWTRVFLPEVAERFRATYREVWLYPDPPESSGGRREVLISGVCPAWMLRTENAASRKHPGGMRGVSRVMQPDVHWVSWKFVRPGERSGISYNGLVRLDDRFAWFPSPWKHGGEPTPDLPDSRVEEVTLENADTLTRRYDLFLFGIESGEPVLRPHLVALSETELDVGFGWADADAQPGLVEALGVPSLPMLMAVRDGLPVVGQPGALTRDHVAQVLAHLRTVDMDAVRRSFED